jgi:hypothetical protein
VSGAFLTVKKLPTDPDLAVGGVLWLERSDGRSVWRQQLRVTVKRGVVHPRGGITVGYVLEPVEEG